MAPVAGIAGGGAVAAVRHRSRRAACGDRAGARSERHRCVARGGAARDPGLVHPVQAGSRRLPHRSRYEPDPRRLPAGRVQPAGADVPDDRAAVHGGDGPGRHGLPHAGGRGPGRRAELSIPARGVRAGAAAGRGAGAAAGVRAEPGLRALPRQPAGGAGRVVAGALFGGNARRRMRGLPGTGPGNEPGLLGAVAGRNRPEEALVV